MHVDCKVNTVWLSVARNQYAVVFHQDTGANFFYSGEHLGRQAFAPMGCHEISVKDDGIDTVGTFSKCYGHCSGE